MPSVNHVQISFQASLLDRKTSLIGIVGCRAPRAPRGARAPRPPRYSPAPAARTYCMRYGASAEAQAACVCSHASPRRARVAIDGPVGRRDMYMCTHNTMPVIHAPTTRTKKSTHTSATCATATRAPACGELRGSCAQSCCKLESRLAPRRAAARRSRCATVAAARGPVITAAIVPAAAEAASSATPAAAEVAPDATGPQPSPTAVEASPLRPQVPEARRERGGSERRRTAVRGVFEASTPGAWLPARRPEKRTCGGGKGGYPKGRPTPLSVSSAWRTPAESVQQGGTGGNGMGAKQHARAPLPCCSQLRKAATRRGGKNASRAVAQNGAEERRPAASTSRTRARRRRSRRSPMR